MRWHVGHTRMGIRTGAVALAVVAACVLASCSSSGGTGTVIGTLPASPIATTDSGTPPTTSPGDTDSTDIEASSSNPPTAPDIRYNFAAHFSDNIGYTYTLTADLSLGAPTAADSSSLALGYDGLYLPISGMITLANTTPGRDAPGFNDSNIFLLGLWKAPSPVCPVKTSGLGEPVTFPVIGGVTYCTLNLANGGHLTSMAADQSYQHQLQSVSDCEADIVCTLDPPDSQTNAYVWQHRYIASIQSTLDRPNAVALAVEDDDSTDPALRPAPCKTGGAIILDTSPELPTTGCR